MIEASTDLLRWTQVRTNVVTSIGEALYRDATSGATPRRFYRVRWYEGRLPAPETGGSVGVRQGIFRFAVSGIPGQSVVVEGSTNLLQWFPLQTKLLSDVPLCFSDSGWWQFPKRFYRVRAQ